MIENVSLKFKALEHVKVEKAWQLSFDSISCEDEETRVFGDTAVVTGRVVLKVIYSGKESSGPYRFINVWVKMQGRWQVAANQITPIAQ